MVAMEVLDRLGLRGFPPRWLAYWAALVLTAALLLAFVPDGNGLDAGLQVRRAVLILLVSALNTEVGRWIEGRLLREDRPNKALSVWAVCTALAVEPRWLLLVVPVTYAHAHWRGIRISVWKWIGSGASVCVAATLADLAFRAAGGAFALGFGLRTPLALGLGVLVYAVAEAGLLSGFARLGHPEEELALRTTLAGPAFYVTEIGLVCVGVTSVLLAVSAPGFLLLMVPIYVLAQQAAILMPMRIAAETDDKSGLLRFEAWQSQARAQVLKWRRAGRPWGVIFLDIDHFKQFNDTHGHQTGDLALRVVADAIVRELRSGDLSCRFGGEEFAMVVGAVAADVAGIAERLRARISAVSEPSFTVSVGVATVEAGGESEQPDLERVIALADDAVYQAKRAGRDCLMVRTAP
jgi:diguanylate cyclase (GGDEF)-like protein